MTRVACGALVVLLTACAGDGVARYAPGPNMQRQTSLQTDYEDCAAQGEMIRGRDDRKILVDNCMNARGYRLSQPN